MELSVMRRGRDRLIVGLSLGVLALSGIVLADGGLNPGGYPPGYEWGRLNCGPLATPPITNFDDCEDCCEAEHAAKWHTQTWLNQCIDYCEVVNWDNW